jgi:hypothetical protein
MKRGDFEAVGARLVDVGIFLLDEVAGNGELVEEASVAEQGKAIGRREVELFGAFVQQLFYDLHFSGANGFIDGKGGPVLLEEVDGGLVAASACKALVRRSVCPCCIDAVISELVIIVLRGKH